MNHLVTLQSLKTASQVVGQIAAKVGEATMQAAGTASSSFHELLAGDTPAAIEPTADAPGKLTSGKSTVQLRQQIAEIAERVMQSIGLSLDQPISLTATDDGHLRVDANHPRIAEGRKWQLDSDPQLPGLVNELLASFRRCCPALCAAPRARANVSRKRPFGIATLTYNALVAKLRTFWRISEWLAG